MFYQREWPHLERVNSNQSIHFSFKIFEVKADTLVLWTEKALLGRVSLWFVTGSLVTFSVKAKAVGCIAKMMTHPNCEHRGYTTLKKSQLLDNTWLPWKRHTQRGWSLGPCVTKLEHSDDAASMSTLPPTRGVSLQRERNAGCDVDVHKQWPKVISNSCHQSLRRCWTWSQGCSGNHSGQLRLSGRSHLVEALILPDCISISDPNCRYQNGFWQRGWENKYFCLCMKIWTLSLGVLSWTSGFARSIENIRLPWVQSV